MSSDRSLALSLLSIGLAAGIVGTADAAQPVSVDGAISPEASSEKGVKENAAAELPSALADFDGLAQPEEIATPSTAGAPQYMPSSETIAFVDETSDLGDSVGGINQSLSWLMIVAGLCPLVATGTLWAMRRRVIQHLVKSVRDRLTDLQNLDKRVHQAQHRANRSIDGLEERVKQVHGEAQELIYQLQDEVESVRSSAEQELAAFKNELNRRRRSAQQYADEFNSALDEDKVAIAQRIAELEHEFMSDMQILAGQAETNKAELLEEFIQNTPATLIDQLQPQIREEIKALIQELQPVSTQKPILTFPNQEQSSGIQFGFTPATYVQQGESMVRGGQYEAALQQYEKALDRDENCYEAWLGKGVALEALQRYEAAIAAYDRAVNIKPNDYEGWYNRGLVLGRLGKYDDAMTSYGQALVIAPGNANLWLHRGIVLSKLSQYEDALEAYSQAVSLKPDSHEAWYNLANAQVRLQRTAEALASYDKALEHNPKNTGAWHNRGIVLSKLGQFDEALESYEQAISLDEGDPETWYSRGNALAHLSRYDDAIESYDRAIALKPEHDRAKRNRDVFCNQRVIS
ncbi:MAG: tetratricopeptide repeat protein [Cyanobacteria bacterium P01_F01_bin.153]